MEEAEGKIQTIMVKDAAGNEARVFIDGYITKDTEVENAVVGNLVEAVGLASYDNTFVLSDGTPSIRVSVSAAALMSSAPQARRRSGRGASPTSPTAAKSTAATRRVMSRAP